MLKATKPIKDLQALKTSNDIEAMTEVIAGHYPPRMSFYEQFESKGGVLKILKVAIDSVKLWKNEALADSWGLWLKELNSFSSVPYFFQMFLKNLKCKDLLFKVLAGAPDQEGSKDQWE